MIYNHDSYSAASYNPVTDEVVTYHEDTPDHVLVHESVHKRMWWVSWLLLFAAWGVIVSLAFGLKRVGYYSYLSYIVLSIYAELTAYILSPIDLQTKMILIFVIMFLGLWNLEFWSYFFRKIDITKPISQATWREILFTPIMPIVFWLL